MRNMTLNSNVKKNYNLKLVHQRPNEFRFKPTDRSLGSC